MIASGQATYAARFRAVAYMGPALSQAASDATLEPISFATGVRLSGTATSAYTHAVVIAASPHNTPAHDTQSNADETESLSDAIAELVQSDDDAEFLNDILTLPSDGEEIEQGAREDAVLIVHILRLLDAPAERVMADADGGVAVYAFGLDTIPGGARRRYARIAAGNDGDILVSCVDRMSPEASTVWDASEDDLVGTLARVASFLD